MFNVSQYETQAKFQSQPNQLSAYSTPHQEEKGGGTECSAEYINYVFMSWSAYYNARRWLTSLHINHIMIIRD